MLLNLKRDKAKIVLKEILKEVLSGILTKVSLPLNIKFINDITMYIINKDDSDIDTEDLDMIRDIVLLSNILYNNTDRELLPLDDGIYDLLMVKYQHCDPSGYLIGAVPINFENKMDSSSRITKPQCPIIVEDTEYEESSFFINDECLRTRVLFDRKDFSVNPICMIKNTEKKVLSVSHNYPKLVGTLDKCKFVLDKQAIDKGCYNDSNVAIFERDFLAKHIQRGIIDPNNITMVLELKYDGISVEADVTNKIISARSRGDTASDQAADLTPLFENFHFKHADMLSNSEPFGMKFEAIITNHNLEILSQKTGKEYKNCRNAIIGLTSMLDGYKYRDLITLVPLATSLEDISRVEEIEFMNKYYYNGEKLRYCVINGDYNTILFLINKFVEESSYMRSYLPFMYDGVVVSYIDEDIIKKLGRVNSVNKYSIAIKYTSLSRKTIFNGFTYTVGKNGVITPMAHFNPIEFYGTTHDKATAHSYERFKNLNLSKGDVISVDFVNDVMCYVNPPEDHVGEPEQFITNCPECGSQLVISNTGKNVYCENIHCPGREISRIVDMIARLNIKDFAEETIRDIRPKSLNDILNLNEEDIKFIGENKSRIFVERIQNLLNIEFYDYQLLGALGFTNIASEKWKNILQFISIEDIVSLTDTELINKLSSIKGVGPSTIGIIVEERKLFYNDLITIIEKFKIISSTDATPRPTVRFTGFRDSSVVEKLEQMGFDVSATAGVTNSTDILLVPSSDHSSSKVDKAKKNGHTKIFTVLEFIQQGYKEYIQ